MKKKIKIKKKLFIFVICIIGVKSGLFAAASPAWVDAEFEPDGNYNLVSWADVDPAGDGEVYFNVRRKVGNIFSSQAWNIIATWVDGTEYRDHLSFNTDYAYSAQSVEVSTAGVFLSSSSWSGMVSSYFIHDIQRGSYADYEDNQMNYGPTWRVRYQMQKDAFVSIRIYRSTSSVIATTPYGMPASFSSDPIKEIVKHVPRSEELLDSSWWNIDEWDCRDDTGTLVNNGIYLISLNAYHYSAQSHDTDSVENRDDRIGNIVMTLPVDVIRLWDFYTNTLKGNEKMEVFHYKLTADAEVKIRVYPQGTVFETHVDTHPASSSYGEPIAKDSSGNAVTPLRELTYYRGDGEHTEMWDGTNNKGIPLNNGIYPTAIMARDPNSNIVATNKEGNDHPVYTNVTLDRAILRLSEFTASTLSSFYDEEIFSFSLSNPANVKIKIYPKETTFDTYIDTDTASSTYGEPIARDSSGNIVSAYKTLNYFKTAGDYKASYNGTKDNGDYLLDGLYPVAIMATDDYGRIASNAEGDFYPVWTKMSINRSADTDDASGDSSGEENETGAGPIVALGAPSPDSIIEQFPQSIVLNISDNSPINWSKSYVSVKNSNGENLKGLVQKNDTSVVFWPSVASPAGSYTIDVEARDIYGFNTRKSFVFTVANSPGSFIKTNIKSYPNPGPDSSGKITFGYGGEEDVVIKIYTLTGSLVKTINSPGSINFAIWDCKEDGVAPGLYIYRVENKSGKSVTKKLVIGR